MATTYGVDPDIAARVAQRESNYNQGARSHAGAIGVMQLMPETAKALHVNPSDLHQNIEGGVRYLKQLHDRYHTWKAALAAYNAGPGRFDEAMKTAQALIRAGKIHLPGGAVSQAPDWLPLMPLETQRYVKGILGTRRPSGPGPTSSVAADDPYAAVFRRPKPGRLQQAVEASTGRPSPLHRAASAVQGAESMLATLPGVRQVGDVLHRAESGVANAPGVRDVGNALRREWAQVAPRLANQPGVKQLGDWMHAHPETTQDILTLVNAGLNVAQILPIASGGVLALRVAAARALSGLGKDAALAAARDVAGSSLGAGRPEIERALSQGATALHGIDPYTAVRAGTSGIGVPATEAAGLAAGAGGAEELGRAAQRENAVQHAASGAGGPSIPPHGNEGMTPALRALEEHPIRRPGSVPSAQSARNFLSRLDALAHSRLSSLPDTSAREAIPRELNEAHALMESGRQGEAMAKAEGVLSYLHQAELRSAGRHIAGVTDAANAVQHAASGAHGVRVHVPVTPGLRQLLTSESGSIDLKPVIDYLAQQHGATVYSGNLGDQLYRVRAQGDAAAVQVRRILETYQGSTPQDQEAVYHALEDPTLVGKLTPPQKRLYAITSAIRDQTEAVKVSLPEQFRPQRELGYVRRFAQGVGSLPDRVRKSARTGFGQFRKTTSAMRHRSMVGVTDTQAHQSFVGHIEDGVLYRAGQTGSEGRLGTISRHDGTLWAGDRDNPQRYQVGQATTREIEAQTGMRYYKNALMSTLIDHMETMQVARNVALLDGLKSDPEFLRYAAPPDQAWLHPSWKSSRLDTFRGWVMDPKVASEFDALAPRGGDTGTILNALTALNRFAVNVNFINPFVHVPNVGTNWLIARGTVRWLNPAAWGRLAKTSVRAWNAAAHLNDDYTDYLRAGAGLMRARGLAGETRDAILSLAKDDLAQSPSLLDGLAQQLGQGTGRRLLERLNPYFLSHAITWTVNDAATLQHIFEREAEGMTREAAIAHADRFIPNYRLPGTILGSQALASTLRNRGLVIFAPYHYGVLKAWGQTVKGLLGRVPLAERAEAADKLAMMGVLYLGVAPALDQAFRQITGSRYAHARRPGLLSPLFTAERLARGEERPDWALESVISPSPIAAAGVQMAQQAPTLFSDPSRPWYGQVADALVAGSHQLMPWSVQSFRPQPGQSIAQTTGQFARQFLLQPFGSIPKGSPAQANFRNQLAQAGRVRARAEAQAAQGDWAAARQTVDDYNATLVRWGRQAAMDAGQPFNAEAVLHVHGLKVPKPATVRRYVQRKSQPGFDIRQYEQSPHRGGGFGSLHL